MTIHLNWQQFVDKYSPIKNTIELDTPCDGFLFLDKDQIRDIPLERIWTLIEDQVKDDMFITNGVRIINAHGWLVTRESWDENEIIEVRLEETDIKKDDR
jgi:hypothetical protein